MSDKTRRIALKLLIGVVLNLGLGFTFGRLLNDWSGWVLAPILLVALISGVLMTAVDDHYKKRERAQ